MSGGGGGYGDSSTPLAVGLSLWNTHIRSYFVPSALAVLVLVKGPHLRWAPPPSPLGQPWLRICIVYINPLACNVWKFHPLTVDKVYG